MLAYKRCWFFEFWNSDFGIGDKEENKISNVPQNLFSLGLNVSLLISILQLLYKLSNYLQ